MKITRLVSLGLVVYSALASIWITASLAKDVSPVVVDKNKKSVLPFSPTQQQPFTDPNKVIQVIKKAGSAAPIVELKIKSNPSTGYSWFLTKYNDQVLTPLGRKFYPDTTAKPGAAGYDIWRFKVNVQAFKVPQLTHITLQYLRPWVVAHNGQKLTFIIVIANNTAARKK